MKYEEDYFESFIKVCPKYFFHGREIDFQFRPGLIGKVIPREFFTTIMWDNYQMNEEMVENMKYEINNNRSGWRARYAKIFLGRNVSWVTWNEHYPTDNPFQYIEGIPNWRQKITRVLSHNLGLKHEQMGCVYTAFVYDLKPKIDIFFPTNVDANGYEYFEPADSNAKYGYTKTYPFNESKQEDIENFVRRRPEAIHGDMLMTVPDQIKIQDFH